MPTRPTGIPVLALLVAGLVLPNRATGDAPRPVAASPTTAPAARPVDSGGLEAPDAPAPAVTVAWDPRQVRRGLPAVPPIEAATVVVAIDDGRVVAPREAPVGAARVTVPLADPPPDLPRDWSRAAARAAADAVTAALEAGGRIAVTEVRGRTGGLELAVTVELGPFLVSAVELVEVRPHPGRPAPAELLEVPVTLGVTESGYVAPAPGRPTVTVPVGAIGGLRPPAADALPGDPLFGGALRQVVLAVRDALLARDLLAVSVAVDPAQITTAGLRDRRPLTDRSLRLRYTSGVVTEVRSLDTTAGERADGLDRPRDRAVREASPIQPWSGNPEEPRRDLLRRPPLRDHLARLERLAGRRVDAAIAAAEGAAGDAGGAAIEYLVREREPLLLLAETSNTGTEQTDDWRTRIRLDAYRPTGREDLFAIEYATAGFDATHLVTAAYDTPLFPRTDPLGPRLRLGATASRYTASDVGLPGAGFVGESWNVDAELSWNLVQAGETFVDVVAGARWDSISVDNRVAGIDGSTSLLRPRIGLRLERDTLTARTDGFVLLETNLAELAGTDDDDLNRVGRLFTDEEFTVLRFGLSHSGWLEPLFDRAAWEDLSTPGSSTLAHELRLGVRGQLAFGRRLIPQVQQVAGGLFSVRGYPEALVAGDDLVVATAEYRFHLPRALPARPQPDTLFGRPFRFAPAGPYGGADWDLVLKAFVDVARASVNDPLFFERGATLVGAGVGIELGWRRNLRLRLDWARAMEGVPGRGVEAGDDRLHAVVTIAF